jgi:hypothetical protein
MIALSFYNGAGAEKSAALSYLTWESGPAAVDPKRSKASGISVFSILIPYLAGRDKPQIGRPDKKEPPPELRPRISSNGGHSGTVGPKPGGERRRPCVSGKEVPNRILGAKRQIWPMLMPHMAMPVTNKDLSLMPKSA